MTDTMFTRTALTEAAKHAGVTTDQARTILEAAGVTVQPEPKPLPTEPGLYLHEDGRRIIVDKEGEWWYPSPEGSGAWWIEDKNRSGRLTPAVVVPATTTPVTLTEDQVGAQHAAPAEGEPIDLGDVREGDRVRVVLKDGDAATFTFTVRTVSTYHLCSSENAYSRDNIRSVHLLHREEA